MRKITQANVQLDISIEDYDEKKMLQLLEHLDLNVESLICECFYDKDRIKLFLEGEEVRVDVNFEKKKGFHKSYLDKTVIAVNSINCLAQLLRLSKDHDVLLSMKSTNPKNTTRLVINDNGHDYVNHVKSK